MLLWGDAWGENGSGSLTRIVLFLTSWTARERTCSRDLHTHRKGSSHRRGKLGEAVAGIKMYTEIITQTFTLINYWICNCKVNLWLLKAYVHVPLSCCRGRETPQCLQAKNNHCPWRAARQSNSLAILGINSASSLTDNKIHIPLLLHVSSSFLVSHPIYWLRKTLAEVLCDKSHRKQKWVGYCSVSITFLKLVIV